MNAQSPRQALVIERLRARFHSASPLAAEQCARWLHALAEADGEALTDGTAGPDQWLLIRHLPLVLHWRDDSSEADILLQWQRALRRALEDAVADHASAEVVRYSSRRAALADLLYRSALGETTRQWAWQRMALIPRSGLSPVEVLGHGLRALLDAPEQIWPTLHDLIAGEAATAALTAVLRGLPAADWQTLLRASPRTAGYVQHLSTPGGEAAMSTDANPAEADGLLRAGDAVHDLLGWAAARHHLAAAHLDVLPVLVAALAWPAAGTSHRLRAERLNAVHAHLRRALRTALQVSDAGQHIAPAAPNQATRHPAELRAEGLRPLPALPRVESPWITTAWAGALFWLGRVPAGHLLAWQAAQDQVSLPLLLRVLGEVLGVPADDAVLRAMCGGELPTTVPADEPMDAARAQAALQVSLWALWLDEAAPELPAPRLARVCQRPGRLRFEPAWIELHLPLGSADTSIRRLGLDLDPGWLPWMGCVVSIIYDNQDDT
jgi:hypothetical protein